LMFGRTKSAQHPGEIPLRDSLPDLTEDAVELARFWVNSDRSFVAVAFEKNWTPELLGSLLVESVHTAAFAYAAHTTLSEEDALERMWSGFDEERMRLPQ